MKKKYVIGVVISISVLTFNQIFIQYWLQKKKEDAEIINIAGRQRMLSQRINLELYKINNGHADTKVLFDLQDQWTVAHSALLNGNEDLNFSGVEDEDSRALLENLTPKLDAINSFIAEKTYTNDASLIEVSYLLNDFLIDMDKAVKALEESANQKLMFIIITEIILALISIIVIISEVFIIYRPISKRLEEQVLEIKKSEKELMQKNSKLKRIAQIQSHSLRKPLANILGLIHLIKFDDRNEFNPLYLEKLKQSAEQLDETVSSIVENTKTIEHH